MSKAPSKTAPAPVSDLAQLPLPSPGGGPWKPGAFAVFADKLWLAADDRIFSARAGASEWWVTHRITARALDSDTAEIAQKLGFVEDGPAAAEMKTEVPGAFGIGPLQVLQGPGDRAPCLYAVTRSLWGARILRSDTGRRFEEIASPSDSMALAGFAASEDWMITAPAVVEEMAQGKKARLPSEEVAIFGKSKNNSSWTPVAPEGLGEGIRGGVSALTWAMGRFYVAIEDPFRGFELWSAVPGEALPWDWTRVLGRGAARFSLAPRITAMAEFGGALYLAAAISETGFGVERAGPAAAELLRVQADGSWDVIVGAPRFSPDGFKVPLSGMSPGFDDPFAATITSLGVFDGVLYAGTRNTRAEYALHKPDETSPPEGGAALWASTDGEEWQQVPTAGHDTPAVNAVRGLADGPNGLRVAVTTNRAVATLQDNPSAALHESELALEDAQIWE